MTATIISPFFDYSDVPNKNKMLSYSSSSSSSTSIGGAHLSSPGAPLSPCAPAGSLLDRKAVGAPSGGGLFQRRHSVSLPSAKFHHNHNQLLAGPKAEPSVLLAGGGGGGGNNKENRFRERSYSELGERLRLGGPCGGVGGGGGGQINSSRYKTELCRPFEENGACKYGDKCQFAHGMQELRSLSRHPKYKTELCRTFHTIGFCPYGPRCHFVHNAEERRGPPPLSAFNKPERPRLQHSFSFAGFPSSVGSPESPTSVTPPPVLCGEEAGPWPSNPFTYSSQELAGLFGPSLGGAAPEPPRPAPESRGPLPASPTVPCFFHPAPESPPSPPDSLSDQEGYQSSLGSQSGSESPLLDASRRLPIFSRLSISDD